MNIKTITIDEFHRDYKPHLDTDGSVRALDKSSDEDRRTLREADAQRRLWTCVANDDGDGSTLESGWRMVNRLFFIITEVPTPENETILVPWD